jgi:hypothetical protein
MYMKQYAYLCSMMTVNFARVNVKMAPKRTRPWCCVLFHVVAVNSFVAYDRLILEQV